MFHSSNVCDGDIGVVRCFILYTTVNLSEMVILGHKSVDPSVMKVSNYSIIFLSKSGPITCLGGVGVFSIYAKLTKSAQSDCSSGSAVFS